MQIIAAVAAGLFLSAAGVALLGSSRRTFHPGPEGIRADPERPGDLILELPCAFDGLRAVEVKLPSGLRERGLAVELETPGGEARRLAPDEEHTRARRRRFRVQPPLEGCKEATLVLRLRFEGAPLPGEDGARAELSGGISVTTFFPLHLAAALENFGRFKPVPAPAAVCAALLLLYAGLLAGIALRVTGPPRP